MTILVTGANGLLGHWVVQELLDRNYTVKIVVRTWKNIFFDLKSVEVITGNFTNYKTLKKAATGCDAIVHLAAITATNLLHYEDYQKINVEGSAQVIRVANDLQIKTVIYISSSNTIGYGSKDQPANEESPFQFPFTESFYARSKKEAEELFSKFASQKNDRHIIIIHPTFMIGAYDTKPSSGRLLLMGYKPRFMFVPKGGKNFVAARDVAVAICNALTMGRNGEHYLAAGVNLSFKEFYTLQKQVGNYQQVIIKLPNFLLKIMGKIGDFFRWLGIKTDVCTMNLQQLMIQEYYSNEKAKKELMMPQTDIKKAIEETLNWFKYRGWI
ncbi:MAG: NAD-dependent epimerase/dehydratase family protein [Paludibacteraceae bacterium]|nr:NAD-dependent epimerase/dehydratase family protein [Paludibacteraceae bacterium]